MNFWVRKQGGDPFGSSNLLIPNLGCLKTPFDFYAKITKLKY